jgi:hypothetical protein
MPIRGFLTSLELVPPITVLFQYNPERISDKRSVNYATLNTPGLLMPIRQYTQGGERTISFTVQLDGRFSGPIPILTDPDGGLTPELNKYRAFMYPQTSKWLLARGSFVPLYADPVDQRQFTSPPTCLFGLGERVIECVVTEVSINELLFNFRLAPVRAEVSATLVEIAPYGDTGLSLPGGF